MAAHIESAMPGFAHLVRLGTREGTYGTIVGQYQFTYNTGGKSWVRTFDDEHTLAQFLRSEVGVVPEVTDRAIEELHSTGHVTLPDIEIEEVHAPALGLEQLPSDY